MALDYIFPNDFPSTIQFIFSNYFSDSQGRFARRRYCQECGKPSKQNNLKSSSKSVYGQFSAWVVIWPICMRQKSLKWAIVSSPKKNSIEWVCDSCKVHITSDAFCQRFYPKLYTRRSCFFMLSKIVFVISWILKYELYKQTKKDWSTFKSLHG